MYRCCAISSSAVVVLSDLLGFLFTTNSRDFSMLRILDAQGFFHFNSKPCSLLYFWVFIFLKATAHLVPKCACKYLCYSKIYFLKNNISLPSVQQSASHCLLSYKITGINRIASCRECCCQLQSLIQTTVFTAAMLSPKNGTSIRAILLVSTS
jgi:hypothetical protein